MLYQQISSYVLPYLLLIFANFSLHRISATLIAVVMAEREPEKSEKRIVSVLMTRTELKSRIGDI